MLEMLKLNLQANVLLTSLDIYTGDYTTLSVLSVA